MRLIPTDVYAADVDVRLEDLRLPVDMAFFFRTGGELKCFYPSPMGPTESLLPIGDRRRARRRRPGAAGRSASASGSSASTSVTSSSG